MRTRRRRFTWLGGSGLLLAALLLLLARRHPNMQITPNGEAVFTSTRYITSLALAPDGVLWVGTPGGILRREVKSSPSQAAAEGTRQETWQKFTRRDGLPSHEVRHINVMDGSVVATFPTSTAVFREGRWNVDARLTQAEDTTAFPDRTCTTVWQGRECVGTPEGLYIRQENGGFPRQGNEGNAHSPWRLVPLPASSGSHISALLPHGKVLWTALFGDGLWTFDGTNWQPLDVGLPSQAREITALAGDENDLWVGTRRMGLWERHGGLWRTVRQHDEPIDHNCQALALWDGKLFVSTLEDGLAIRTAGGWGHASDAALSSNAPRQMVGFQNALYLRHGNGKVDRLNGTHWTRSVCAALPRKQASALAADARRLYVAQWGGWSEFDGTTWTHHLDIPQLQGLPITALCPQGDTLWVGTQGRGLAQYQHSNGSLRWHDERNGLPDDWITTLACLNGDVYAGTFVGGLARYDGARWTTTPPLKTENVTALEPDGSDGMFIATRNGVWHEARNGSLAPMQPASGFLDHEAQALCHVPGGLWIGTRTGLFFCPD